MADLPITGGFQQDNVIEISSQRSVNFYAAFHKFGKKKWTLNPTQGTSFKVSIGSGVGPVRGAYVFATSTTETAYFCSGNSLFKMDSSFTVTSLGVTTFTTTEGPVSIVASQTQIIFCDGVTALIYTIATNTLALINDLVTLGVVPADITYMDSYFIAIDSQTNNFYVSAQDNGSDWTTFVNRALIDTASTFGSGCARLKRRLFLFGNNTTEVWLDAGAANLPFRRDDNLLFEHGLEAVGSLVEGFDRLFYLSRNTNGVDSIKMVEGTVPVNISTYEINKVIQRLDNTQLAVGTVKKIDGIIFYKITIDNRTFVYNVTMSSPSDPLWHEENIWGLVNGIPGWLRHIENCHIFFEGNHYIGDYASASLYLYDSSLFSNDGISIKRQFDTSVFSDPNYLRIMINRIQLDMLQGVGIVGTDSITIENQILYKDQHPVMELYVSVDGGITYKNRGLAKIGQSGTRTYRTYWNQIDNEFMFIFRFVTFNSVPIYIIGGSIEYKVGTGV